MTDGGQRFTVPITDLLMGQTDQHPAEEAAAVRTRSVWTAACEQAPERDPVSLQRAAELVTAAPHGATTEDQVSMVLRLAADWEAGESPHP